MTLLLNQGRFFLHCVVLTVILASALVAGQVMPTEAQDPSSQDTLDPTLQPISAAALKQTLQNYSDDPIMTYQLVLRAEKQKEADIAFETLNGLRKNQPKNAVAQAGYCLAFDVYAGKYSGPSSTAHSFSEAEQQDYDRTLAHAQQLNPKLWLIYAVAGHNVGFGSAGDIRSLDLYKKAEALAPYVSYTHTLLGNAYANYYTPYNSFKKAAIEYKKALSLQPASAEAAWGLFDIYDVRTPNAAEAKLAKIRMKSLLPPGYQLRRQTSERLAKY